MKSHEISHEFPAWGVGSTPGLRHHHLDAPLLARATAAKKWGFSMGFPQLVVPQNESLMLETSISSIEVDDLYDLVPHVWTPSYAFFITFESDVCKFSQCCAVEILWFDLTLRCPLHRSRCCSSMSLRTDHQLSVSLCLELQEMYIVYMHNPSSTSLSWNRRYD